MSAVRYRRVSQNEANPEEEEMKKRRAEKIERATAKIHAAVWVGLSGAILYYTDFFNVALHDPRVNRCSSISKEIYNYKKLNCDYAGFR